MKRGADWYQREPIAYLGGVQGLTIRQHAVYSVILDLLYMHGGEIINDPKFVSGYFSDLGISGVRNVISELIEIEKLEENCGKITQKRAKNQAKTKEEFRKKMKFIGEIGGKKSGQYRKNNSISKPIGSEKTKQIREDKNRNRIEIPNGISINSHKLEKISPNGFDEFWLKYPHPPNRGSKQRACVLFENLSPLDRRAIFASLAHLNEYLSVATWRNAQMASTYLNHKNRNWENEYDIDAERRKSSGFDGNTEFAGEGHGAGSIFDEF